MREVAESLEPANALTAGPRPDRARFVVDTADEAVEVFQDRAWGVTAVLPYLEALQVATGEDLSVLAEAARASLIYQSGADHLMTRRAMAAFLSPAGVARWEQTIDGHVEAGLARLVASPTPDLVRDFSDPLFVACARDVFGLTIPDEADFLRHVYNARIFTEPLLRLRELLLVQHAYRHLVEAAATPTEGAVVGTAPAPLVVVLARSQLPAGVGDAALVASITVAAHTAAESLSFALLGLLRDDAATWGDVARPGWADAHLEQVIRDYPSTLRLYRVAQMPTVLNGRPVVPGDLAALDIPAVNRSLCPQAGPEGRRTSLSFGDGMHKCPGAALARLMLRRALPALADRFPHLRLDEAAVRIERTHMVQAPTALPCRLEPSPKRRSARLWDVTEPRTARAIAVDDRRFSPPGMETHLISLQHASGRDLSTAIRIARNAPFFQSGPRHARMRLLGFEALGSNRLASWTPLIEAEVERSVQALDGRTEVDLVKDFCEPLFRAVCQPIMGVHPRSPELFNRLAPLLQEVLEPLRSLRAILKMQEMVRTLLGQFDEPALGDGEGHPTSLLSHLAASGGDEMDAEDRKAFVLVLYGASFNVAHTLANAILALASTPAEQRGDPADPAWIAAHLDTQIVPEAASPRFIYRIAQVAGEVDGMAFAPGDTMRLRLAAINRDLGTGHLAFGHGLHRCIGAALSRLLIRKALPALFARYPGLHLTTSTPHYADNSQTVILTELPCRLIDASLESRS
ncbi:MAG: hypothetical protein Q8M90_02515 [Brevundimonas sp.]|nr:hypothetical protein [Brevundimonas sp.]MDZ4063015.1 hypothetical protein [Brevundimonas sp.]